MEKNIPQLTIKYRLFTILGMIILVILGISSFFMIPRAEDPLVDTPIIGITVIYPGATAMNIEKQVVNVIESDINELEDIKEIISHMRESVANIYVEFDYGIDPKNKLDKVQAVINSLQMELPAGIQRIEVKKYGTDDVRPYQLALVSEAVSYNKLREVGIDLEKRFRKIEGVRKIEVVACPKEEVRIALDPIKMTARNVSLFDIEQAITSTNTNIPGGTILIADRSFDLLTSGTYADINQIKNTIIKSYLGKLIYLKDIARVYKTYEDEKWTARYNGERCILINIQTKGNIDIYSVLSPVQEIVEKMKFPKGVELKTVFNQSKEVKTRTNGFRDNLLQGIFLVGLIIFVVLGFKFASLVMIAIPFSMLTGLWIVYLSGFMLEQTTIAAMIVALGLLVDNSIAIVENIERFMRLGYSPKEAAIKGTQQLIAPVATATLTTILGFLPLLWMNNLTGAFIRSLPVTVIATLSASLLIAVTVTPFFATLILKKQSASERYKATYVFSQLEKFVEGTFTTALNWTMRHQLATVVLTIGILIGSLGLFTKVGIAFFPKAEKPLFRIAVELPEGFNRNATDKVLRHIESVLDEQPEVDYYVSSLGNSAPIIYYNMIGKPFSNRYGDIMVFTKNYEPAAFTNFLDRLRGIFKNYSKAQISIIEFGQGPMAGLPIEVVIKGENLDQLKEYARQVTKEMDQTKGMINLNNPLKADKTDLFFDINKEKALLLGVPIHVIDQAIRSFVQGKKVGSLEDQKGDEFNLVLRMDFKDQFQIEDFEKISVQSLKGFLINLRQLANITFKQAPSMVSHTNFERSVYIEADVATGYLVTDIVDELIPKLDVIKWEEGYSYELKGEVLNKKNSFDGVGNAALLALLLILAVLIIHFRSFTQPLIIFSALPFAVIGSILALYLTGHPFSFMAFIGLTSLIGIAINDSLVLVDYANELRKEGNDVKTSVMEAAKIRFIPIIMTTITTILGLLPLTLIGGSLWTSMGWVIIGGLVSATFFVLLVVPILYLWFTPKTTATY